MHNWTGESPLFADRALVSQLALSQERIHGAVTSMARAYRIEAMQGAGADFDFLVLWEQWCLSAIVVGC